jgi:tetratricopeptide (TPR) repeat protein
MPTMRGRRLAILTSVVFAALAMSPRAGLADDRYDCEKLKGEPSITACTRVIEAGTYSASVMAIAYLNRGLEYFDKGYYDQAINDYSASIALNPKNADVYNNRGNAYHAKRDYDRAIGDFNQAIAIDPGHALAYNNRAIAYGTKGEPDRAIEDYGQAIALNPAYAGAYSNRGNIFFKNGEYDRALADFDQAIVIDPRSALFYRNRAKAYQELRLYERAIADYQRSLELKPSENAQAGLKVAQVLLAEKSKPEPAPEMSFRRMPNTDLAGSLIGEVKAGTQDDCESACAENGACRAYSFNMWNSLCFLKGNATLRTLEPSTMSGLKSETYPPPFSGAEISMVRFRHKLFPGDPFRQSSQDRFEDCEAVCRDSESCVAFSFIKTELACRMFDQAGEYSNDESADSGAKRQAAN